jgi:hypothetical protein
MHISDRHGVFLRQGARPFDIPLSNLVTPSILRHLTSRGLFWAGQLAAQDGKTLAPPSLHGINPMVSRWWTKLKVEVCHNDSSSLLKPVSLTVSPIRPFVSTHPPGTVVTVPSCTADGSILPPPRNRFFVVNSTFVKAGVENCMVRELHPNIDPLWQIDIKGRSTHVKSIRGHTYRRQVEATEVEEFAACLLPVVWKWVQITTQHNMHLYTSTLSYVHVKGSCAMIPHSPTSKPQ